MNQHLSNNNNNNNNNKWQYWCLSSTVLHGLIFLLISALH